MVGSGFFWRPRFTKFAGARLFKRWKNINSITNRYDTPICGSPVIKRRGALNGYDGTAFSMSNE